ncbi:MAG: glycosyl hydrolase family 28 protein [Edaphobacter sp.]
MFRVKSALVLAGVIAVSAQGQDTRTVTEPVFPPTCSTLQAQQAIVNGEPSSETIFDTTRLQAALTSCATGQAVELQISGSNNAFLIQPITIPTGVTLLVDGGVTVFASRNPADYQVSGAETCGTVGTAGNGCNPLFNVAKNATSSGAGIMGYGVIDGRGEDKLLINGTASTNSWWDIANQAELVSNGAQNNFVLLAASKASNFTLYKITLRNSAMFHVTWKNATGLTVWGTKIITPFSARNSDGIDPDGSNITITNSSISDGDDNIAVSASSASSNITVSNDNTYSGHGISVGSFTNGGLTNMLVTNINQAGTLADNNGIALRLKTAEDRGGLLQNITYQNICMQNHFTLISITPFYNTNTGTEIPQFENITFQNVHGLTNGLMSIAGHDATHLTTVNLNNFVFDKLTAANLNPAFTFDTITLGPGPVSPAFLQSLTGTGVTYNGSVTAPTTAPYACSASTFTFLVGELYLSNSTNTNLSAETVPGPGTVTLNAMLQPAMSQVTYQNSTGTAAPSAAVQFMEGANVVGTASLGGNGTIASLTLTGVSAGVHTYTAQYPGDSTYAAYPFGIVTVTVSPFSASSTTALTASPSPVQSGSSTMLTAMVTGMQSNALPTGMVSFFDGTTMIGSSALGTASSGTTVSATLSTVLNGVGAHSLSAQYSGDSNNAASTSPATSVTVTAIPTTTTLSLASMSIADGAPEGLTAAVTSSAGVPTGTVTFFNGTASLGTATLSNGTATLAVTSNSVGSEAITAVYSATGNFSGSTSAALMLSVTNPLVLTLSANTVSIAPGASGTVTVSAAPGVGFTGPVTFACSSPVAYVTCSPASPTQTITGMTAVQSGVTVNVAAAVSELKPTPLRGESGRVSYALLFPLGAFVLLGFSKRGRLRKLPLLVMLCLGVGLMVGISGCSGGPAPSTTSTPPPVNPPTAPSGTQVISITAMSAAATQTIQLTVNIGS